LALASLAVLLTCGSAQAAWPDRPIKLVVGFAAGGPTDIYARMLAKQLSEQMSQKVLVENKPGANANIAAEAVVREPADGYTFLFNTTSLPISAGLYAKLNYDPRKDLVPVARVMAFPLLFLFLMVPLPQSIVNTIAFPLQLTAAGLAVEGLHLVGVPALVEGNIIHLANGPLFVAEACSGLRSLMALVTLGVVFAYFFRRNLVERIIIVASTIPIAILVNSFRVGLTGVLASYWGHEMAGGVVHETQGMFTFGIAFLMLLGEAWLLSKIWPRIFGEEDEEAAS
jgi:exosortase/archaeosortase family protein